MNPGPCDFRICGFHQSRGERGERIVREGRAGVLFPPGLLVPSLPRCLSWTSWSLRGSTCSGSGQGVGRGRGGGAWSRGAIGEQRRAERSPPAEPVHTEAALESRDGQGTRPLWFSCPASAQSLISWAWLSWLPKRRLAGGQAAAGGSLAPPLALSPSW